MSIAVLHKKDGTGRIGVTISRIASVEEVLGANTATQYSTIQIGQKFFNVTEDFHEVLKAMNFTHQAELARIETSPVETPPAGG